MYHLNSFLKTPAKIFGEAKKGSYIYGVNKKNNKGYARNYRKEKITSFRINYRLQ